ncbi:MAG: zinc ribbon domain-containing protein, partial [Candidatus Bathyarchaeota archaeon]
MVYCPSCGELNEDENENCKKCGAPLRRRRRIYSRRYDRTICFGVPVASYFLGLIFGLMI